MIAWGVVGMGSNNGTDEVSHNRVKLTFVVSFQIAPPVGTKVRRIVGVGITDEGQTVTVVETACCATAAAQVVSEAASTTTVVLMNLPSFFPRIFLPTTRSKETRFVVLIKFKEWGH